MNRNSSISTKINDIKKNLNARKRKGIYIAHFHVWYISMVENTVKNILPSIENITKYNITNNVVFGCFDYDNLSKEIIVCKDGTEIMSEYDEWKYAFSQIKKTRYAPEGIDILSK